MFTTRIPSLYRKITIQIRRYAKRKTAKTESEVEIPKRNQRSHAIKLGKYLESEKHLLNIREFIPKKYMDLKLGGPPDTMYLIDENIAKTTARHVLKTLNKQTKNQVVCETNAGLGLISSELLDRGLERIRMYEYCPEFRQALKEFLVEYPDRVELFTKDLFQVHRIAHMDKLDRGNRVDCVLKNLPIRKWDEDPVLTVIGTIGKSNFFFHLIKSLGLHEKICSYGRIQVFAFMKPEDYIMLSAKPDQNLHLYQRRTVLFNLFFDHELLEKYPRKAFLPWNSRGVNSIKSVKRTDPDYIYLVKATFKRELPVPVNDVLYLYYFIRQFFARGGNRVIPTLEKMFPDCGPHLIVPSEKWPMANKEMNIYTKFGDLSPQEHLAVFRQISELPNYLSGPFTAMVQAELTKYETRETAEDDFLNSQVVSEIEKHL